MRTILAALLLSAAVVGPAAAESCTDFDDQLNMYNSWLLDAEPDVEEVTAFSNADYVALFPDVWYNIVGEPLAFDKPYDAVIVAYFPEDTVVGDVIPGSTYADFYLDGCKVGDVRVGVSLNSGMSSQKGSGFEWESLEQWQLYGRMGVIAPAPRPRISASGQ